MKLTFRWWIAALLGGVIPGGAQSTVATLTRSIEYYNPDWSPNGRELLFESTLEGKYAIYVIRVDGSGLRRLTDNAFNSEQARWAPDGSRIVFSSDRDGHLDLYSMNPDGADQVRLTVTSAGGYYQASFSPDGKWIAFQGRSDSRETRDRVFVARIDGTSLRQLTDPTYGAEGPEWARDGKTISFRQVPYPKQFWADMSDSDFALAHEGARWMQVQGDGSGLAQLPGARVDDSRISWARDGSRGSFTSSRDGPPMVYEVRRGVAAVIRLADASDVPDSRISPDGRLLAYTKSVDGWWGLYVFDVAQRKERRLTGGPGAGPLGYLRIVSLMPSTDTLDSYVSAKGDQTLIASGSYVVRTIRRVAGRRWEVSDTWRDSTGRETARQWVRIARGSSSTEVEGSRSPTDSASMLLAADRVTAWIAPQGASPQLYDAPAVGERFSNGVVAIAIAKSRPAVGAVFVAPIGPLFSGNPTEPRIDSICVTRRDSILYGAGLVAVLVLEHTGGLQQWVDERSGTEWVSRGNAGAGRWWWHIRRGARLTGDHWIVPILRKQPPPS